MPASGFPADVDFDLAVGPDAGNRAFFGSNVLQALIEGIEDFTQERQPRWERRSHRVGPCALLGCSPWVDDWALLDAIARLPSACVVVSKPPRASAEREGYRRMRGLNETTNGIELRALSGLGEMAPKVQGQAQVIGPYDQIGEGVTLSTFRTIGHRKGKGPRPPIAHAKLALLGHISWTDEHPSGHLDDYIWFSPKRLWVSSANFTYGSRTSAEFGYWTEDRDLMAGVARFLTGLIGGSEDLDSTADNADPELARVEFDDAAMADAAQSLFEEE